MWKRIQRLVVGVVPSMLGMLGVVAGFAGSAFAAETRVLEASFGPDGTAATHFGLPTAVGVDDSTGEVYVADVTAGTIEKFNSEHQPESFSGINPNIVAGRLTGFSFHAGGEGELAVNSASQVFYAVDNGTNSVRAFQSDGEPALFTKGPGAGTNELGGFGELCGVAVDSGGDIYAGDYRNGVAIYAPSGGEPLATIAVTEFCNVAVDSHGNVYVNHYRGAIEKFTPSEFPVTLSTTYTSAGAVDPNVGWGVAVSPVTNDLLVDEHNQVAEYGEGGERLFTFPFPASGPGALTASEGLAVDTFAGADRVYVSDGEGERRVEIFGAPIVRPNVTTGEATNLGTAQGDATLTGTVNPLETEVTSCVFEYGPEAGVYTTGTAPCTSPHEVSGADPLTGNAPIAVSANLTGLTAGRVYHYRLTAANSSAREVGQDESFTAPGAVIDGSSAVKVSATSAELLGQLNPGGTPTEYHFEYDTREYKAGEGPHGVRVPAPDASAGSEAKDVPVSMLIEGLLPGTTYHYRLVAHNPLAPAGVQGADHTFTTDGAGGESESPGLIDGRQWEMVSPPAKHGANLEMNTGEGGLVQASEDGGSVAYFAEAPIDEHPEGNRSFGYTQLLSKRTGPGVWSTLDVNTREESVTQLVTVTNSEYKLFSPELSTALLEPAGATPLCLHPATECPERTPYLRDSTSGSFEPLLPAAGLAPGVKFGGEPAGGEAGKPFINGTNYVTATPDLSHVVVGSVVALTPGFESHELASLYEWSGGALQLVSILPGEAQTPAVQAGLNSEIATGRENVRNAVSTDGTRVVFTTYNGRNESETHLYVRDVRLAQTVQLDVPQEGVVNPGEPPAPQYLDASSDGSRIFFKDDQRLTLDSNATTGRPDLYMCEMSVVAGKLECALRDLSVPVNAGEHAGVSGVDIGTDTTGRLIYFVASGVLSTAANAGGEVAQAGQNNLYVLDTTSRQARLVTAGADPHDWTAGGNGSLGEVTARVSPDGRFLAFMSQSSLTGYDNEDASSQSPHERMDQEVFLYHAPAPGALSGEAGSLVCASCDPSGARPHGMLDPSYAAPFYPLQALVDRPDIWGNSWLAGSLPGWRNGAPGARYQSRYLSDSGRLFFNSPDSLVPKDTNEKEDVYEYEPGGVGGCAQPHGCVGLISSGTSSGESAFMDASAGGGEGEHGQPGSQGGEDVFFMTSARLAPQDVDSALDVYDAHLCSTASPCAAQESISPSACETSDSCRPAPAPRPSIFGVPPTGDASGPGNPAPPPAVVKKVKKKRVKCKRGFVKKKVKKKEACVKNKSKRAKKSTNRMGSH